jgi:hypothetical protein
VELWTRQFGLSPDDPLLQIPAQSPPVAPPPAMPSSAASQPPRVAPKDKLTGHSKPRLQPSAQLPVDPILAEALRMWPGRVSLEDFDMELWLGLDDLIDGDLERRKYER